MGCLKRMERAGVVPVVVLERASDAVATAQALLRGGIDVMEITFRTAAAPDAIRAVAANCPDMLVGAGTVISAEQCETAMNCGAKFVVSPGFDPESVRWCREHALVIIPGCVTPTEIMAAQHAGISVVKFFPANVYGGLKAMKSLSAPFSGIRFVPTGGVNAENAAEYLAAPYVAAVGGSWLCTKSDISAGNFDRIAELAAQAHALAEKV